MIYAISAPIVPNIKTLFMDFMVVLSESSLYSAGIFTWNIYEKIMRGRLLNIPDTVIFVSSCAFLKPSERVGDVPRSSTASKKITETMNNEMQTEKKEENLSAVNDRGIEAGKTIRKLNKMLHITYPFSVLLEHHSGSSLSIASSIE